MKFTTSNDGILRTNIRVEHRLSIEDLTTALAAELQTFETLDDLPEFLPKADTLKRIKDALIFRGESEVLGLDLDEEYVAYARKQIERLVT